MNDEFQIIPYGVDRWIVEHRRWYMKTTGYLWWQRQDRFETYWESEGEFFSSEEEAEEYIDKRIIKLAKSKKDRDIEYERKEKIKPRIYP